MTNVNDISSKLPDGTYFDFWEVEQQVERIIHVDCGNPEADDNNTGAANKPFKSINAAAQIACPGDKVLIHAGVYRETVSPARSGEGADRMIVYEAVEGEEVIIKASVEVTNWKESKGWALSRRDVVAPEGIKVWETKLNPEDFKGYNPFCCVNIIGDRLFIEYAKTDMTPYLNRRGMVFVDGKPMKQVPIYNHLSLQDGAYFVEHNGQKVHVRLPKDANPKDHIIELSNREQCFAPETEFLSYIKVKGIICAHAANGAPVPQRGSISTYRGHHWIIEDCTIDWANTVGIDCGNECWHHERDEKQELGYHIIRRNKIFDSGVCGIAAIGSTNLLIEDNLIDGTGWQRMELSWEAGGIKVHHAQSALFRRNIIRGCIGCDAIWMDVDNNNCRLSSNLLIDGIDSREHIFMECNRDTENLIDNNIIWNVEGRYDRDNIPKEPGSSGWYKNSELEATNGYGIYVEGSDRLRIANNLIGKCNNAGFFAKTVAFRLEFGRGGTAREHKLFNNIFYACGEAAIKFPNPHNKAEGNTYGKMPQGFLRVLSPEPAMCLLLPTWQEFCGYDLNGSLNDMDITIDSSKLEMTIELKEEMKSVATDEKISSDYFGKQIQKSNIAGPIQGLKLGKNTFNIDPRKK